MEWTIFDKKGNVLFKTDKFDTLSKKEEGIIIAKYKNQKKYIFINEYGKQVVPGEYEYAEKFYNGYAIIKKDGKDGIVDKKGNITYSSSF